jgi:hypothetical protein
MLKMTPTFLNRSIHPFYGVFCDFYTSLLVSAGNSTFRVIFEVLQLSWVIVADSFFTESTQKGVRWRRVLWTWWPKATFDNAITEEFLQESCCVRSMAVGPSLLKPAIPLVFFQHSYELEHQPLTTTEDFHALHVGFPHS